MATVLCLGFNFQSFGQHMGNQTVAQLKESPAGNKVITFVNTVNKGEEPSDELIKSIFSEALIKKTGLIRLKSMIGTDIPENDGKLTLYKVDRAERLKFKAFALGSNTNEWVQLEFTFVRQGQDYKISGLGLDIVDKPEGVGDPMKIG